MGNDADLWSRNCAQSLPYSLLTSKISAKELPGVAAHVTVKVKDTKLESTGPLITTGE
jgi:hypothetical protein